MIKTYIYSIIDSIKIFKNLKSDLKIKLINKLNIEKYSSKQIIISQNFPINKIFIVSKGSFILLFNHIKISTSDDLNIDFYINYQNFSNKHFNNLRKHELNGKFSIKFTDKLIIYSLKEFIGDIEFSLNKNKSLFTVVCNENNSELLSINFNDFEEIVGKKIINEIKNFSMEKIKNFNQRIKEIENNRKKYLINEEKNIKNNIIKRFNIENFIDKKFLSKKYEKNFNNLSKLNLTSIELNEKNSFRKNNNKKLKNSISSENIINNNKINKYKFLFDNKENKTERKNNNKKNINNFFILSNRNKNNNNSFKNFSLTKNSIEKSRNNNNDAFYIKSYNSIDKPKNIFGTNSQINILNSSENRTKIKLKLKNKKFPIFIKQNFKKNKIRLNIFNKNIKNLNDNFPKEINFEQINNNNFNNLFNKNIFFKKNFFNHFLYDKYKLLRNHSTSKIINNNNKI